jgi:hypothetical protein
MLQAAGTGLVAVLSPAPAISGPMAGDLSSTSGSGNGVSGGVNDDEDLGTHPMLQRVQSLHFDKDDVSFNDFVATKVVTNCSCRWARPLPNKLWPLGVVSRAGLPNGR